MRSPDARVGEPIDAPPRGRAHATKRRGLFHETDTKNRFYNISETNRKQNAKIGMV